MTTQERSLIDRYIDNSLSGVELKDFMDKLEQDENFRKQVSFHNLLIEAIQISEDDRLEKAIIHDIGYRKPKVPAGLKMILTFLFITAVGISLWQYIGTGPSHTRKRIFSLDLFKKKTPEVENTIVPEVAVNTYKDKNKPALPEVTDASDSVSTNSGQKEILNDSTQISETESENNFVVKQDQLLVTHTLKASAIQIEEIKKQTDNSLAQSTAGKLNPAGGLVETQNSNDDEYEVQFWLSPVNYRGYKLNSNKLILFGIEEPDAVKLYSVENKLMMKYGQDYFRLNPSEEFISFLMIKNTDLPAALK